MSRIVEASVPSAANPRPHVVYLLLMHTFLTIFVAALILSVYRAVGTSPVPTIIWAVGVGTLFIVGLWYPLLHAREHGARRLVVFALRDGRSFRDSLR